MVLAPTYFISQNALIPLLLLSKPQSLRWFAVWFHIMPITASPFLRLPAGAVLPSPERLSSEN